MPTYKQVNQPNDDTNIPESALRRTMRRRLDQVFFGTEQAARAALDTLTDTYLGGKSFPRFETPEGAALYYYGCRDISRVTAGAFTGRYNVFSRDAVLVGVLFTVQEPNGTLSYAWLP